jgi:hypothetical protein
VLQQLSTEQLSEKIRSLHDWVDKLNELETVELQRASALNILGKTPTKNYPRPQQQPSQQEHSLQQSALINTAGSNTA